ncbi:MAG: DUF898 domain-containing protein [Methylobacteriaceae bacterium]|nr:DUF898 domain-containing protein [Methylobacteriaceae bacterium]
MNEIAPPPGAPQPAADAVVARVEFVSERRAFFRLLARGALLQLLTFGFYRFWLITDIRRHLWTHTRADGDSFEYTGRATELLIGFLIAMAILAPIYVVYFLAGVEAERLQAFLSIPLFLLLYVFGHFAIYRSRRYRLTRTIWRGVRFWMDGSGWAYALRVLAWSPLVLLTAGLAYPWRAAALERYKMRHTHYGDLKGDFVGRGGDLFRRIWWLILIAFAGALAIGLTVVVSIFTDDPEDVFSPGVVAGIGLVIVASMLALPVLLPIYRAIEWRWWAEGARLGEARLTCDLSKGALLKLYFKAIFAAIGVTLAFALVAFLFGGAVLQLGTGMGMPDPGAIAAGRMPAIGVVSIAGIVLLYLGFILALNATTQLYLQHDYWRDVATSLSLVGLQGMRAAAQSGEAANAIGEGLADGLDVAGF